MAELLSEATVGSYLVGRGILRAGPAPSVRELGGGVSNVVFAVEAQETRLVVKQSLPRLRVVDEWLANRERALTEAAALDLAGRLTPGAAPRVLDVDGDAYALVVELAPTGWRTWKELLLAGRAEPEVAERVGRLLGVWHGETARRPDVACAFDDVEVFEQLRVDPYYRTLAQRRPELAAAVERNVSRMLATRLCLVHGDYSPKNVLVGDGQLWVIDFEVAHVGDPVFDLAFMLNHLLLKAVRRPALGEEYERCAQAFWEAYRAEGLPPDLDYLLGHVGCLMAARVDGKSPVEYLDERGRQRARALGASLLLDPPTRLEDAWARL